MTIWDGTPLRVALTVVTEADRQECRKRYGHSETSWPRLWKKVFAEVEGEEFANRVVVEAKLEAALGAQAPVDLRRVQMLYWSVSIV